MLTKTPFFSQSSSSKKETLFQKTALLTPKSVLKISIDKNESINNNTPKKSKRLDTFITNIPSKLALLREKFSLNNFRTKKFKYKNKNNKRKNLNKYITQTFGLNLSTSKAIHCSLGLNKKKSPLQWHFKHATKIAGAIKIKVTGSDLKGFTLDCVKAKQKLKLYYVKPKIVLSKIKKVKTLKSKKVGPKPTKKSNKK